MYMYMSTYNSTGGSHQEMAGDGSMSPGPGGAVVLLRVRQVKVGLEWLKWWMFIIQLYVVLWPVLKCQGMWWCDYESGPT